MLLKMTVQQFSGGSSVDSEPHASQVHAAVPPGHQNYAVFSTEVSHFLQNAVSGAGFTAVVLLLGSASKS
jgi:hypothetical protein